VGVVSAASSSSPLPAYPCQIEVEGGELLIAHRSQPLRLMRRRSVGEFHRTPKSHFLYRPAFAGSPARAARCEGLRVVSAAAPLPTPFRHAYSGSEW
jgi:hypothetical protein